MGSRENPPPAGQAPRQGAIGRSDVSQDAQDRRLPGGQRRRQDLGPPSGVGERRQATRRATDVPKPSCPWCGSSSSTVYRSKALLQADAYRRRRVCADCGRTWPTRETLDVEQFERELATGDLAIGGVGLVARADTSG